MAQRDKVSKHRSQKHSSDSLEEEDEGEEEEEEEGEKMSFTCSELGHVRGNY